MYVTLLEITDININIMHPLEDNMHGMRLLWLLHSSAVSVLGHWRLLEITGYYWITDINMKSTEVQTSPMLASGSQLLACGIYACSH